MTISLPWDREQADYVADLLRQRAQSRVDLAQVLKGGSLVRGLRDDLGLQAIMIDGMATDLLHAEVTDEREDDLEDDLRDRDTQAGDQDGSRLDA